MKENNWMLFKIILGAMGLFFSVMTIFTVPVHPPVATLFGFMAAMCFIKVFFWPLAENITMGVFAPSEKNKTIPFLFDRITSLIAKNDYDSAIAELEDIIAKDKTSYAAVSIAANLYAKKFNAPEKAIKCIKDYLSTKQKRSGEDLDLILMFADICIEAGKTPDAIETLSDEMLKNYSSSDKRSISMRIESLNNKHNPEQRAEN